MKKHLRIFSSMVIFHCSGAIASAQDFAYTGGFQTFDVLTTGIYNIMAYGAQGGGGGGSFIDAGASYLTANGGVAAPDGSANGYVRITQAAVPEPSSALLIRAEQRFCSDAAEPRADAVNGWPRASPAGAFAQGQTGCAFAQLIKLEHSPIPTRAGGGICS